MVAVRPFINVVTAPMENDECLYQFTALQLHFQTTAYDYFLYKGQLKRKLKPVEERKDKFQFAKLARQADPVGIMLANFAKRPNIRWVGDMLTEDAFRIHKEWMARIESLTYTFKQDIKKLEKPLEANFTIDNSGQHPVALRLFLGEHLCLETITILESIVGFYNYWDKKLQRDIVWKRVHLLMPKYRGFLTFDREKFRTALKQEFV